jgi:hypothetical protein
MLTGVRGQRKRFFLSDAQKKYRTMFFNQTILRAFLSKNAFTKLMFYLSVNIFPDYLKQVHDHALKLKQRKVCIQIKELPFTQYNRSEPFKILFLQRFNSLNITLEISFNTPSVAKQFWYLKYYRYIFPVHETWL